MEYKVYTTLPSLDSTLENLGKRVRAFHDFEREPAVEVIVRSAKSERSLSQNALFWQWMESMSTYFTKHSRNLSKDEAHDLMCHLHLGYVTKTIGQQEIRGMRTTTWPKRLTVEEMGEFMDKIDAWAADKGCYLPTPADCAHDRYMKKNS